LQLCYELKDGLFKYAVAKEHASSVANDLRGLAWLAFPAGVSPIFAHSFFNFQQFF
jgi:hypothetical protein